MPRYRTKLQPRPKQSLLPIWFALVGLVLIVIAAWALLGGSRQSKAAIEVQGAPRLKVDTAVIDRGNVRLGTLVRDEVRVTNVGDQPLRFTEAPYVEVRAGC